MPRRKASKSPATDPVADIRHEGVTRVNIPPPALAARGKAVKEKQAKYAYNPHLTPVLRFDATGSADHVAGLLAESQRRALTPDETKLLQEAFRNHQPWLEWSGKREQQWCVADPVALNIHERISTKAILAAARRQDIQRDMFADPEQEYREAVQFYRHSMDWTNRMILGDSLAVMASLAQREALAGKVQTIYMDPPYGIKYSSNFQSEVGRRDVKDRDEDLTREPEMVKAYRDTWTLGMHSYLSYLRDRLLLCRELLSDTGSVFVQMGDENAHAVRCVMDEVFGRGNSVATISYRVFGVRAGRFLDSVSDNILWYAKRRETAKFRPLFSAVTRQDGKDSESVRLYRPGYSEGLSFVYEHQDRQYQPPSNMHWATGQLGLTRLSKAERLINYQADMRYRRFATDFPATIMTTTWDDTWGEPERTFVVKTSTRVSERCILMTTDPGDLVLDPTCGSGTTAYVAEEWGRRWITIDVSRVALAIARQRLLTAKYEYYRLRPTDAEDVRRNPEGPWLTDPAGEIEGTCTFDCRTVSHIMLKSIAQNQALDPIFQKWEPVLAEKLAALNRALKGDVGKDLRTRLTVKLDAKRRREGVRSITDADTRRWKLPETEWQEWEAPFDTDPDWPQSLQKALLDYRASWRQKMDEVNQCIAARADQEELVDQPYVEKDKVRVSGPFTMEGVIPAEESIEADVTDEESPFGGAPEALDTFDGEGAPETEPKNAEAYLDRMVRLLRQDGIRFPDNKVRSFTSLEALAEGTTLHAEGTWGNGDGERSVAVMFGPQYGSFTASMAEDGVRYAARRGYDDLVFAAFSFDGAAQAVIQEDPDPDIRIHMAHIRPDVNMDDLLKTTVSSQLFTVSGSPRTRVERSEDHEYRVHMEGVDIYDPVTNSVRSTGAEKVTAWFLDSDYDGRCFCICQAFFPDQTAWQKLGKALGGTLDEGAFAALSGTVSLPLPEGKYKRIAVKVIDPRGNEVLRVHRLGGGYD